MAYEANGAIEAWLAQETPEEALEPDIPIVDPVRCPPPLVRVGRWGGSAVRDRVRVVADALYGGCAARSGRGRRHC